MFFKNPFLKDICSIIALMTGIPSDISCLLIELHPMFYAFAAKQAGTEQFQPLALEHQSGIGASEIQITQLSAWLKRYQAVWSHRYDKISISLHGLPLTVVPSAETASAVWSLVTGQNPDQYSVLHNNLTDNWVWAWGMPKELRQLLDSYFLNAAYVPSAQRLGRYALQKAENGIYLHITPGFALFFCMHEGRPVYSNQFNYTGKEDLLYYVLLVYQQLDLNAMEFPLIVSGLVDSDSQLYQMLFQFVSNIRTADPALPVSQETLGQQQLQPHYLTCLFEL